MTMHRSLSRLGMARAPARPGAHPVIGVFPAFAQARRTGYSVLAAQIGVNEGALDTMVHGRAAGSALARVLEASFSASWLQ